MISRGWASDDRLPLPVTVLVEDAADRASTTTSSPSPRSTGRLDKVFIVGRSGRIANQTEHGDAYSRKTPSPTEHNDGARLARPGPPPGWNRGPEVSAHLSMA